nr:hypothetical protein CFP56_38565 [Quercus suber]
MIEEGSEVQVGSNGSGGNSWRALQVGFVKVNFGGAIFSDSRLSSIGVVIRDSNGAVLASCAEKIGQAYKAEETKALAALKTLTFAHELGFQNVVLEGDALGLIQALKLQEQNLYPWGSTSPHSLSISLSLSNPLPSDPTFPPDHPIKSTATSLRPVHFRSPGSSNTIAEKEPWRPLSFTLLLVTHPTTTPPSTRSRRNRSRGILIA